MIWGLFGALGFLLLLILGLSLLMRGRIGRAVPCPPTCAGCGYDLRVATEETKVCPECGKDLSDRGAVHFGRILRSRRMMIAGAITTCVVILAPFAIGATLQVVAARARDVSGASEAKLIDRIGRSRGTGPAWEELARRYTGRALSPATIDAAVEQMIADARPPRPGIAGDLPRGSDLFELLLERDDIAPDQLARLIEKIHDGPPTVTFPEPFRRGERAQFSFYLLSGVLPGAETCCAVRTVRLDGGRESQAFSGWGNAAVPSGDRGAGGYLTIEAEPGPHELTFEIDVGMTKVDPDRPSSHRGPGPASSWREPLHVWTRSVTVPVEVLPGGDEPEGS